MSTQPISSEALTLQARTEHSFIVLSPSLSDKQLLPLLELEEIWKANPDSLINEEFRLFGTLIDVNTELYNIFSEIENAVDANKDLSDSDFDTHVKAVVQVELDDKSIDYEQSKTDKTYQAELAALKPKVSPSSRGRRPALETSVVRNKIPPVPTAEVAKLPLNQSAINNANKGKSLGNNLINTGAKLSNPASKPSPLTGNKPGTASKSTGKSTGRNTNAKKVESLADKMATLANDKVIDVTGYNAAENKLGKPVAMSKTGKIKGYEYVDFDRRIQMRAGNYDDFKAAYLDLPDSQLNDGVLYNSIYGPLNFIINKAEAVGFYDSDLGEVEEGEEEVVEKVKPVIGRQISVSTRPSNPVTSKVKAPTITQKTIDDFMDKLNEVVGNGGYLNVSKIEVNKPKGSPDKPPTTNRVTTVYTNDNFALRSNNLNAFKLAMQLYQPSDEDDEEEFEELKNEALAEAEVFFSKSKKSTTGVAAKVSPLQRKRELQEAAGKTGPSRSGLTTTAPFPGSKTTTNNNPPRERPSRIILDSNTAPVVTSLPPLVISNTVVDEEDDEGEEPNSEEEDIDEEEVESNTPEPEVKEEKEMVVEEPESA